MNHPKLQSMIPWNEIERTAQVQIENVLELECLKTLAIMPDVHAGYDLPIGGVALLDGFISPSFVGYDIGCGMCAIDTGALPEELGSLETIYNSILSTIPTGFKQHEKDQAYHRKFKSKALPHDLEQRINDKVQKQLGTLGGGNHFIEIGISSSTGNVAITIHSGSRNVGHSIGGAYMKLGRLFPVDSELGMAYKEDMDFALDWALTNRLAMMRQVMVCLGITNANALDRAIKTLINENHNHASITDRGVLHRKGATPAKRGQLGIIPANMRDGVYITSGLGNKQFLESASHGCGRKMGRKVAKKILDYEEFKKGMDGIYCSTDKALLDEAPQAYKDIDYVKKAQEGVSVEFIAHIKPIINIKAQE